MDSCTLLNLIEKVRSWISWGRRDSNLLSCSFKTTEKNCNTFCDCGVSTLTSIVKYQCLSCGRWLCGNCVQGLASLDQAAPTNLQETARVVFNINTCKLCFELGPVSKSAKRCSVKVYTFESPRQRHEPSSPSFSGEKSDGHFPYSVTGHTDESFSDHISPIPVHHSSSRSDEAEGEDHAGFFFSHTSEYLNDPSNIDSVCLRARHEFCSLKSKGSNPSDSPSRIHISSNRVGHCVQRELEVNSGSQDDGSSDPRQAILKKPAKWICDSGNVDDLSTSLNMEEKFEDSLDIETNDLIWIPPPPHVAAAEKENNFYEYEDEDDEVGSSVPNFSADTSPDRMLLAKKNQHMDSKEPLRVVLQERCRGLVSQLLQGQGIVSPKENCEEDWLNIIMAIAWQTTNYIKPNTNRGGSMDPRDYVKVKCVASGYPSESKLIKGIVCTKNIKQKRMTSQYRNTKLLLLGGALEYQRVPNQLASFDTLLQQEKDHLKMIISKIGALRPNVLLVEKSVSSFAQDQLLEKEISLVLNVKRPLLEMISRCTGAVVAPSADHITKARLGQCELFHLEKITEEHESINQFSRKASKSLMFFEGCPRRLGCTVVLRGSSQEILKKVKNVVQYAIFAAYHLSLETSFLIDEGASLFKSRQFTPEKVNLDKVNSVACNSYKEEFNVLLSTGSADLNLEHGLQDSLFELGAVGFDGVSAHDEYTCRKALMDACDENLALDATLDKRSPTCRCINHTPTGSPCQIAGQSGEVAEPAAEGTSNSEASTGNYSTNYDNQSILVSFSSHCILNGSVCESSRLLRVKLYGLSDKPLGRYLREDLFDKSSRCQSCKESTEAHSICYTHQQGKLTINVRHFSSVRLPGEQDGKIWMWHRCLRCSHIKGLPPASQRVIMSDAAWGLSLGKFLELSFSQCATGNRVACCGHSLQRDCLRFYGFGNMIALFRYSPISIYSVHLPPSILEICMPGEQIWIRKEASELLGKAKGLYAEISAVLQDINNRSLSSIHEFFDASDLHGHVLELSNMVAKELNYYQDLLQPPGMKQQDQAEVDILEINRLRHSLLNSSDVWYRRLYLLNSLLWKERNEAIQYDETAFILSDKIDFAWSGSDQDLMGPHFLGSDASEIFSAGQINQKDDDISSRRLLSPKRVLSFGSAERLQERMSKVPPPHLHLSTLRSFHASGDYRYMVRDPVSIMQRTCSQVSPCDAAGAAPTFIPFLSLLPQGARPPVPQNGRRDVFITVYDNEPTSIVSYALTSKEYADWIAEREVNAISTRQSLGSMDFDSMHYTNHSSEDISSVAGLLFAHPKSSPHLRVSFEDESSTTCGKTKFDVTCYFAKQFDDLRKRCWPSELDFVRSLSRCRRWSAQGGKSNVYFAKSFDERFIIKQVTKTELESFNEFSSEYFKYLTEAYTSGTPTGLAKILGIYQVEVKHSKGGKETKMDLMVMENLFFKRSITKVYDLKGSARCRYNSDTKGTNKVLLDMNLQETLCRNPIFVGSKAKRKLERAVWNDTSFLASVEVMDYSLLVGVDEEQEQLVVGIIDYMRRYTWEKQLETWVKASGILGGPKNASPTIISPKLYKKRFRKAMTTYFLTIPDH